jgi:hypothetical protein
LAGANIRGSGGESVVGAGRLLVAQTLGVLTGALTAWLVAAVIGRQCSMTTLPRPTSARQQLRSCTPKRPGIPGILAVLRDYDQWGDYVTQLAERVANLAQQVRFAAETSRQGGVLTVAGARRLGCVATSRSLRALFPRTLPRVALGRRISVHLSPAVTEKSTATNA